MVSIRERIKNDENLELFQFQPEQEYLVFVGVDCSQFDGDIAALLKTAGLFPVREKASELIEKYSNKPEFKLLAINLAAPRVAAQIGARLKDDSFGLESISPNGRYNFYRHQGQAMMIYGLQFSEWEMGVLSHFAKEENWSESRRIINRYLSWALAPVGVIGLQGYVDEEARIILERGTTSEGNVVFVDAIKRLIFFQDVTIKMEEEFKLFKNVPKKENFRFYSKEELLGIIMSYCNYFSYDGRPLAIRQVGQYLAQIGKAEEISLDIKSPHGLSY